MKSLMIAVAACCLINPVMASARIKLNVNVVHKKGIDNSLFLKNETHSLMMVDNGQKVEIALKDGPKIELTIEKVEPKKNDKSSVRDPLNVKANIYDTVNGKEVKVVSQSILSSSGAETQIQSKDKHAFTVAVSIRPELI